MTDAPLLSITGLSKAYPGVQALRDIPMSLHAGEVLALLGENGAGKSTLIKILAGAVRPDAGTIAVAGQALTLRTPLDSRRAGIAVIHQEFNLVPTLSAADNLFLGNDRARLGFLRRGEESRRAQTLFHQLGADLSPDALVRDLSVAQQQIVEIARALLGDARILILDEPTAALAPTEVQNLFAILRDMKARGIGIVYVSHRLDEIFALADRAHVLRDGRHVRTARLADVTRAQLIEWMVGRPLDQEFPPGSAPIGAVRLRAQNLRAGPRVRDVSFTLRAGEIVALTGLVGSGRTETARLLFGADPLEAGALFLDDWLLRLAGPRDAIRRGIVLLTEDRKAQGLILAHSVSANFALPNLNAWSSCGWLRPKHERTALAQFAQRLSIKMPSPDMPVGHLSGGNQQKVFLAKWLQANAQIVLFDEPTRGIDVGAKVEIYRLMRDLAREGKAILMVTSELPEALGMADRILVMHEGRLSGEITDVRRATQEDILRLAVEAGRGVGPSPGSSHGLMSKGD